MNKKLLQAELRLKAAEEAELKAAAAVAELAAVLAGAPANVTHAYLVKKADQITASAKRAAKALDAWRKHY